jgi:hypothetical protein
LIKIFGGKSLIFIDESGFEPEPVCVYALEEKRKKSLWGENRKKRKKGKFNRRQKERGKELNRADALNGKCERFRV